MQYNSGAAPQDAYHEPAGPRLVDQKIERASAVDWEAELDDAQKAMAVELLAEAGNDMDPAQLINLARSLEERAAPPVP